MLPKKNRADKKTIEKIFKEGRILSSPYFSLRFIRTNKKEGAQISFIVPKTVSKSAVKRNALRRKGYRILSKYIKDVPEGTLGAFIFKKNLEDSEVIENEVKNLLSKIN